MNKKFNLIEKLKTVILVVLFLITILLLYLCFNQHGSSLTISEIFPGGHSVVSNVNENDYILPEYALQSNNNATYSIAFQNKNNIYKATEECMESLLSSSAATITSIDKEEFKKAAQENESIQIVFNFDIPFEDFANKLVEKRFELPENLTGFNTVLFSNLSKECFYMKDSKENYFKLIAGENFYAIDRFSDVLNFESKTINHSANIYDVDKILVSYNMLPETIKEGLNGEKIAEKVFSDTFDFVRKIKDSFGNETYMYGYGQKRLSIRTDGSIEFKSDVANISEPNFYTDLNIALSFLEKTLGLEENNFKIEKVELLKESESSYYRFTLTNGVYSATIDVKGAMVSYFFLEEENLGAIWIGRELKTY